MLKKTNPEKFLTRAKYFVGAFLFFVFTLALLFSLGRFFILVLCGLAEGMLFLAIYSFVLYTLANRPYSNAKPKKETQKSKELKAYIQFHLPIVISVLLVGLLIALIIVFWFP